MMNNKDETSTTNPPTDVTVIKPVAIKSAPSSPSGSASPVASSNSTATAADTNSNSIHGRERDHTTSPISRGSHPIAFHVPNETHDNNRSRNLTPLLQHKKLSAFMNWIPTDRSSGYLSSVFQSLRITDYATVVMKNAFDRKNNNMQPQTTSTYQYTKRERPHNIAYITIPANSILDTDQGRMFLDGIRSENYQIILDCGHETNLTPWQYRAYPLKKKLHPNELPTSDLPKLGIMHISLDRANIVESFPPQGQRYTNSRGNGNGSNVVNTHADNEHEISIIENNINESFDKHDADLVRSLGKALNLPPKAISSTTKTFATVIRGESETSDNDTPIVPPRMNVVRDWADCSEDTVISSSTSEEKETKVSSEREGHAAAAPTRERANAKAIAKPSGSSGASLQEEKNRITKDLVDLHKKSIANVSSKEQECDIALKAWNEAKEALEKAKSEKNRFESLLDMISKEIEASNNEEEEKEIKDLFIVTNSNPGPGAASSSSDFYHNKQNGRNSNGVDGYEYLNVYDPHSGHVTPTLFWYSQADGSYSPVCTSNTPTWSPAAYGNAQSYGPPSAQYEVPTTPSMTPTNDSRKVRGDISGRTSQGQEPAPEAVDEVKNTTPTEKQSAGAGPKVEESSTSCNLKEDATVPPTKLGYHELKEILKNHANIVDLDNISTDQLKEIMKMRTDGGK